MKKRLGLSIMTSILGLSLLVGCGGSATQENTGGTTDGGGEPVNLVLSHTGAPDTPVYDTYEKFKEELEAISEGEITVKIHHSGTLAGDTQGVEMLLNGTLDIATAATNNMSPFTDAFQAFDLPYMFKDVDATHKVLENEELASEFEAMMKEDVDLELLFYLDPGSQRDVMNSKVLAKVPADLKGMKFRAAESPIELAANEALGVTPTPITWVEVYSALEQGVVDGLLQQHHWAVTANLHEVTKYVTETGGIHAMHIAFMSKKSFDSLSEEQQNMVLEAAQKAQAFNFENAPLQVEKMKEKMAEEGVEFYTPTPEEMELWVEAGRSIWPQFEGNFPEGLIDRIQAAQE
ncbi:TRAP transporter substrate-binding protein [Anaerobacillus sp. MEB173]|uniref:TRAP transporter substrate-binding protein n=1 Tax=Anaerobacillus sp. MEB173 TaxID=3383345 RepID=UPI003F93B49C